MDDFNLFLTLTPDDKYGLAADSFRLPHNSARYAKPSPISRETTPGDLVNDESPGDELNYFHRIQLRFNQETKVKGRITFGSDPDRCDVILDSRRPQFYISFDSEQRPAIWDESNNGLIVSYDGQAKDERRNKFKWIFFPEYQTIRVTIPLRKERELAFNVHLHEHHETYPKEYQDNVKRFMVNAPEEHEAAFDNLGLRSLGTSFAPSESLSPNRRPIYLKRRELGSGAFGQVWKIVNASTGFRYAGKEFFHKKGWEKEIEIMKYLHHDHIVRFVDFRMGPKPLLVMEYLPLGNLEAQHKVASISDNEMMVVFYQCLGGLSYLHSQNITHRDLKPENILLLSRIHIKLADFGMAQDRSDLKTFCGSPMYAAPEIFLGRHYTSAVDIWSLAVIVMKFMYGLCQYKEPENVQATRELRLWGEAWCRFLIKAADDWDSDEVIDFLKRYMIRWEPQERLSAAECLREASRIGLFRGTFSQTGYDTPRLQPRGDTDDSDLKEASTIMEPLWQDDTAPEHRRTVIQTNTNHNPLLPPTLPRNSTDGDSPWFDLENVDADINGRLRPSFRWMTPLQQQVGQNIEYPERGMLDHASNPPLPHLSINSIDNSSARDNVIFTEVLPFKEYDKKTAKRKRSVTSYNSTQVLDKSPDAINDNEFAEISTGPQSTPILVNNPPGYITMTVAGNAVSLRQKDSWLNATQIVKMTGKTVNQRAGILKNIARTTKIDLQPFHGRLSSWVPFQVGVDLCHKLGILEILKPLLNSSSEEPVQEYFQIETGQMIIYVRSADFWINVTHIWKITGGSRHEFAKIRDSLPQDQRNFVHGHTPAQGTYVDVQTAFDLCTNWGLNALKELIEKTLREHGYPDKRSQRNEPVSPLNTRGVATNFEELPNSKYKERLPQYFQIKNGNTIISVRSADYWINASHIWKVTGRHRQTFAKIRESLRPEQYSIVSGGPAQGTYVDTTLALGWCADWGLDALKELIETTLREHGYQDEWSQPNDQHLSPINDSMPAAPLESIITNGLFQQAGDAFLSNLQYPNPSPQSVVWKSRSQLSV